MQFFVDTASIAKSNPSQLIEFNLGALQSLAACKAPPDANNPACINRPASVPNALDTRNVDIDMSYVNVAFGPATLAPFQNDQTGFVGTPQPAENFSTALNNFLASSTCQPAGQSPSSCNGWPQFFHTNGDKTKEVLLKLASPLEAFARLTPPTTIAPPDLCGFDPATPCSTPTGQLQWPSKLWPPIQVLLDNWVSHAGSLKNYPKSPQLTVPDNLPQGSCGPAPTPGTFCAAIMDIKTLIIRNYNNYRFLATRCATVDLNDFTAIAHLYGWTPFVEGSDVPCLGAADNLLQNTPFTAGQPNGGSYKDNNFALYRQVKLEFDQLNYNLLTDNTNPYNFNPWVGCDPSVPSVPPCSFPNGLIHGSNFVNARNVYAYSVDDAVGNLQSEGGGFIIDVGSSKNLCTGAAPPCTNQSPAGSPINVNLALDYSKPGNINFTNYGLCQNNPNDPNSYKSVNTLSKSFIINASNPKQCPVFLVDSKGSPQLYTFTVTTPPAQAPSIPPPYILVPPGRASSSETAAVIDCLGNKSFPDSSRAWCCKTRPDNLILGVWASSMPNTTVAHRSFDHFITTNVACPVGGLSPNCSLNPGEQFCSLGQPVQ
jgi:hypothetical protein